MPKAKVIFVLLTSIFLLFPYDSKATHAGSLDMFYRWEKDSTYEFTLVFYRNCHGFTASAPGSVVHMQVLEKGLSKIELDLSNLLPGLYFIQLKSTREILKSEKLIYSLQ